MIIFNKKNIFWSFFVTFVMYSTLIFYVGLKSIESFMLGAFIWGLIAFLSSVIYMYFTKSNLRDISIVSIGIIVLHIFAVNLFSIFNDDIFINSFFVMHLFVPIFFSVSIGIFSIMHNKNALKFDSNFFSIFLKDIGWSFFVIFFLYIVPINISILTDMQDDLYVDFFVISSFLMIPLIMYTLIISFVFIYLRKAKLYDVVFVSGLSAIFIVIIMSLEMYNSYISNLFHLLYLEDIIFESSSVAILCEIPMFFVESIAIYYLIKKKVI